MRLVAGIGACLAWTAAAAADFAAAYYDPARDELVVEIDYRGTHAEHDFQLHWGPCSAAPGGSGRQATVARVVDTHGRDLAKEPYRARERFSLDKLPCRPADVTLRMGRGAHATVAIPGEP